MSEKRARQMIEKKAMAHKKEVADQLAMELLNSPFKYRFLFAMKVIFHRRKK